MGTKESIERFLGEHPYYKENAIGSTPDLKSLSRIKENIKDISIKVFHGDWCPDCRAQLPPFINILMTLENDDIELEFIETGRSMVDGLGKAQEMNVLAIPTFIFLRKGKEIGRIIERPKGRMEEDIAEIISQ